MLYNAYGLQLDHYIDTQQTNFVWKSLMKEVSTRAGDISRTMEVSLTALLSSLGFYHPVSCELLPMVVVVVAMAVQKLHSWFRSSPSMQVNPCLFRPPPPSLHSHTHPPHTRARVTVEKGAPL